MRSILQKSRLLQLMEQRNGYLVLACGLILLSLLLTSLSFYLSNRERIVLVPPTIEHSFWVSSNDVSPEYLAEMSTFFAYLRLNVTPESVDEERALLLRYVDPKYYSELNNRLIRERDRIMREHISSSFYPVNIEVDTKALTVRITGDLISSVGSTVLSPERLTYLVKYHYDQGRLWVSEFEEVNHAK
jgi:conjugal transfer pilus assembly protein TraE